MGNRWLNPKITSLKITYAEPCNLDAPSFLDMKRQLGKASPSMTKKVFRIKGQGR
jgi:hypothetical protein